MTHIRSSLWHHQQSLAFEKSRGFEMTRMMTVTIIRGLQLMDSVNGAAADDDDGDADGLGIWSKLENGDMSNRQFQA
eukprot:CAMPEP_0184502226 /NCGR_PEP_ID=MMETSP0113_2-20130426/49682_1 /TAXON_ID=91329 /ORGANISM="Norrisiella sphaerica, Strain BC52" /LENGTH=76 /DNA_ID=CAMNT_0026891291 /DNA_START=141 /DNA_END=367 /DNA_ORIENTATION=-